MTDWHKWSHFHKLKHGVWQDSAPEHFEVVVQLMLGYTQFCRWKLWALRWQSVRYLLLFLMHSVSVRASCWPARLEPAAAWLFSWWALVMLVSWHLTEESKATVTIFTLSKNVGDNVTPLAAFSSTFPPQFGMSNYPEPYHCWPEESEVSHVPSQSRTGSGKTMMGHVTQSHIKM